MTMPENVRDVEFTDSAEARPEVHTARWLRRDDTYHYQRQHLTHQPDALQGGVTHLLATEGSVDEQSQCGVSG
ncbi:MAG: hypothetical protein ACRDRW_02720 [Pseudonocardiaceae bacterium]